jgi:hypothetical protein
MKKITFESENGKELVGVLEGESSETCFLLIHGFLSDKDENTLFPILAEKFNNRGFGSFRFDFAGCGESEDTPLSFTQMRADLQAILDLCLSLYDEVILLGHSLGGSLAAEYEGKKKILLAPLLRGSQAEAQRLEDALTESREIQNAFGKKFIVSNQFTSDFGEVNAYKHLKNSKEETHIVNVKNDKILPKKNFEGIKNIENDKVNVSSIKSDHFFTTNRESLLKLISSMPLMNHQ